MVTYSDLKYLKKAKLSSSISGFIICLLSPFKDFKKVIELILNVIVNTEHFIKFTTNYRSQENTDLTTNAKNARRMKNIVWELRNC